MGELLRFAQLRTFPELVHGISDRSFGPVHPPEAGGRERLAAALGIPAAALVPTHQVHGSNVVRVPGPGYGCPAGPHGADGLITDLPGLYLLAFFADCLPVLAYDPRHRAVGLAHAGWRGTVQGIATRLVKAMQQAFGSDPGALVVGLGPAIGPCCYEVGPEVVALVRRHLPDAEAVLRPVQAGHAFLDLREANRRMLIRAGVPAEQIESATICTACHVDRFYSYRREGRLNGLFGAVIGLRPAPPDGPGGRR